MVEYAILLAHNSAQFMGGVGGDVLSWASRVNWTLLGYAAAGLVLLRFVSWIIKPTRHY
jgi:hypothetical protein